MIELRAFKAIRPTDKYADKITVPPYDVLSEEDIKNYAKDKNSMIHVIRSEVNFYNEIDIHSREVYESAKNYLEKLIKDGVLFEDDNALYIYTETLNGRSQSGIVGLVSVEDYLNKKIKVHELTLKEKELDRTNHFYHMKVQDEPVFLFHEKNTGLKNLISKCMENKNPIVDFVDEFNVNHKMYKIEDDKTIKKIITFFEDIGSIYIADGHHRTASIATVCQKLADDGIGKEESKYIMATIFPEDELNILAYNRLIKDLNGLTKEEFLEKLEESFKVEKLTQIKEPDAKNNFTFIFKDECYNLKYKKSENFNTYADSLDVSILQREVLEKLLNINDIRVDKRIEFYGGFSSVDTIKKKVDLGYELGILMYPITSGDIVEISDRGEIMPPKSTWFEPKLRSGLLMHRLV